MKVESVGSGKDEIERNGVMPRCKLPSVIVALANLRGREASRDEVGTQEFDALTSAGNDGVSSLVESPLVRECRRERNNMMQAIHDERC